MQQSIITASEPCIYIYDNTFEGLLTCIFESYNHKQLDSRIITQANFSPQLFAPHVVVNTDVIKANRVWKGVISKTNIATQNTLTRCFLSELPQREEVIFKFIQYVLGSKHTVAYNYANKYVLELSQICKMVGREKHRMEAFVRFQKLTDGTFYAVVEPDFNVLPLIAPHFQRRYADQIWIIYDIKRKYGISYDLKKVTPIAMDFDLKNIKPDNVTAAYEENELLYQTLWKAFFTSVNIKERKNIKLHLRSLPYRYWKYLTEKQIK